MNSTVGKISVPRLSRRRAAVKSPASPLAIAGILATLLLIAGVAYFASFVIAGLLYVGFFVTIAIMSPQYAYMLIFAAAPFAWDVAGGPVNMAISEISFALALPFILLRSRGSDWARLKNPLWIPICAYFFVCLFSTIANNDLRLALPSLLQMVLYVIICVVVFSVGIKEYSDIVPAFYGLIVSMAFISMLVIVTTSSYVLGLHKNLIGTEQMYAIVIGFELWLALALDRRKRKMTLILLIILVIGLVMSRSRGAWAGTFVGIVLILLIRRQFGMAMKAMLLLVPIIVVGWFLLPKEAREAAADISTGSRFGSAATRLISVEYAYSIFQSSPIYGAGVGLRKIYDATNLIMLTLAETGIAGLVTFGGIFVVLLFMAWKAQRRLPKKDPAFSLLVIGIALMFGKATHGLVDHYWSRGVIPVWAGAGFVAFAYVEAMKRPLLSKGARKTR
jgi:hypothetical protein